VTLVIFCAIGNDNTKCKIMFRGICAFPMYSFSYDITLPNL